MSCFVFSKTTGCFSRLRAIKWSARLKWPPIVPLKFKGVTFELIKNVRKFLSPEVWPEVSRKYKKLFSWANKYELRQHAQAFSFCPVLTVHSTRRWVCLLKDRNGRICYTKKEDATVKLLIMTIYYFRKNQLDIETIGVEYYPNGKW